MNIVPIVDSKLHATALMTLYHNCFGRGNSAQEYDTVETYQYLKKSLSYGLSSGIFNNEDLVAAIVSIPMSAMTDHLPESVIESGYALNGIYIAELMVNEHCRGQGLGKQLLEYTIKNAQHNKHENLIIRVWDQNKSALTLYRHAGFIEVAEIFQTKTKPQSGEIYEMRKVYLHRKTH